MKAPPLHIVRGTPGGPGTNTREPNDRRITPRHQRDTYKQGNMGTRDPQYTHLGQLLGGWDTQQEGVGANMLN